MSLIDNYKGDADMQRTYNIPFLLLYEISIKPNLFKNSRPYVDVYTCYGQNWNIGKVRIGPDEIRI